jgi:hypothetical protein
MAVHPPTRDTTREDACVIGSSDPRHFTRHHNSVNDVRRYRRCEFEVRAPAAPDARHISIPILAR